MTKVNRRDFMKVTGLAAAGMGLLGSSCTEKESGYRVKGKISSKAKARKIVFIMTDTQRYDMLGCVNKDMKTPWLDKLAGEGMRFDKAYSCSPVCGPARSTIFTGTYPHTNGVWGNNQGLADNVKTIGQRLSDNGYHCAYTGKWHLDGTDYFGNGICPDGWDPEYWYDMKMYLEELPEKDQLRSRIPTTNDEGVDEDFPYAHGVSNRAIQFLEQKGDDDFFLVASYDEPHHPFICPEPYAFMYKGYQWPKNASHYDDLSTKPPYQQQWGEGRQFEDKDKLNMENPYFFGCNSYVDYEIGRVLQKIEEVCPDALVIYTSDHGDFLHAHSLKGKGPCVYDDVARIPFIMKWPGYIPGGTVCKHPVSHINIVPTLLEVAGLEIPDFIQGPSILKSMKDPRQKSQEEIFVEFGRFEVNHDGFGAYQPLRSIFDGKHKLSINLMCADELYDMENDPYEVNNLIASSEYSGVRNELHQKILDWMNNTRDPFRGVYWEDRAWKKDFEPSWEYTQVTRSRKDDGYYPRVKDYNTGRDVTGYFRHKEQDKKK